MEKIKILFIGANPRDTDRIRIEEEVREIEESLKTVKDRFQIRQVWAVTPTQFLKEMLYESPNVVHFSGHGATEGIFLEDVTGNAKMVSAEALGELFKHFSDTVIPGGKWFAKSQHNLTL